MDLIVPGNGILLWQLAGLSYLGFWVYAFYDMNRSDFKESYMKSSMTGSSHTGSIINHARFHLTIKKQL